MPQLGRDVAVGRVHGADHQGRGYGPKDITISTTEPGATDAPPTGFWLITFPAGTMLLLAVKKVPRVRPAPTIDAAAFA